MKLDDNEASMNCDQIPGCDAFVYKNNNNQVPQRSYFKTALTSLAQCDVSKIIYCQAMCRIPSKKFSILLPSVIHKQDELKNRVSPMQFGLKYRTTSKKTSDISVSMIANAQRAKFDMKTGAKYRNSRRQSFQEAITLIVIILLALNGYDAKHHLARLQDKSRPVHRVASHQSSQPKSALVSSGRTLSVQNRAAGGAINVYSEKQNSLSFPSIIVPMALGTQQLKKPATTLGLAFNNDNNNNNNDHETGELRMVLSDFSRPNDQQHDYVRQRRNVSNHSDHLQASNLLCPKQQNNILVASELTLEDRKTLQELRQYYRIPKSLLEHAAINSGDSDGHENDKLELPAPENVTVLIISWYPPVLKLGWNITDIDLNLASKLDFYDTFKGTKLASANNGSSILSPLDENNNQSFDLGSQALWKAASLAEKEQKQATNMTKSTDGIKFESNMEDKQREEEKKRQQVDEVEEDHERAERQMLRRLEKRRSLLKKALTCFQITYNIINSRSRSTDCCKSRVVDIIAANL